MNCLNTLFVNWNPSPVIVRIGSFELLWYGVLFAAGLLLAGNYLWWCFRQQQLPQKMFERLIVCLFIGMFVGARMFHCLFYEPEYFFARPVEMLFPVMRNADGSYYFSGYHGLASHGGAFGVICALLLFARNNKGVIFNLLDYLAIATPLAGGFIRLGNLMNSEIVGAPTSMPWGFVFEQFDSVPRHPAQLYEAIFYFALFAVMASVFFRCRHNRLNPGFYFSVVMIAIPVFRFLIEFCKEVQVSFEQSMILDMGQWLSIPFAIAGVVTLVVTQRTRN